MMNPLDIFAKFIRGDYFTGRMWKWTGLVVVSAFAMVYSSASMDQKVYRIKNLTEQKNTLATEYVEIQSRISQVRMESGMLERFSEQGFKPTDQPVNMIQVDKKK